MYIVFKAYGKTSPFSYYGYTRLHDVREGFMQGAVRGEQERGDVRFLALHGINNLMFEELEICETELEAWMFRNDYRAADKFAYTGPTVFPGNIAQRVAKEYPDRMADWQQVMIIRRGIAKAKTARQAWASGRWTQEEVKALGDKLGKKQVSADLSDLTPNKFAEKYSLA